MCIKNSLPVTGLSDCCLMPNEQFSAISCHKQVTFIEMMMRSALYYSNILGWIFNSACSLKQQSVGIHVTPLRHIILIPCQPVFALTFHCRLLCVDAIYTNFIVFS